MQSSHQAILKTLLYADFFDYPLTLQELHSRLIQKALSLSELKAQLIPLFSSQKISRTNKFFHLPQRQNLVKVRKNRTRWAKTKLTQAQKVSAYLSCLPSVLGVFVTGSLASKNTKKNDDIDLMLITHNHTLWTTRLILTPTLDLLKQRRKPNQSKKIKNKLCLNLYLTPTSLTLPPQKRGLYTAYELALTQSILDKHNLAQRLLFHNRWLKNFLPNFPLPSSQPKPLPSNFLIKPLEQLAFKLQYTYMKSKITQEKISLNSAFFHPRDLSQNLLSQLKTHQKRYNLHLF